MDAFVIQLVTIRTAILAGLAVVPGLLTRCQSLECPHGSMTLFKHRLRMATQQATFLQNTSRASSHANLLTRPLRMPIACVTTRVTLHLETLAQHVAVAAEAGTMDAFAIQLVTIRSAILAGRAVVPGRLTRCQSLELPHRSRTLLTQGLRLATQQASFPQNTSRTASRVNLPIRPLRTPIACATTHVTPHLETLVQHVVVAAANKMDAFVIKRVTIRSVILAARAVVRNMMPP